RAVPEVADGDPGEESGHGMVEPVHGRVFRDGAAHLIAPRRVGRDLPEKGNGLYKGADPFGRAVVGAEQAAAFGAAVPEVDERGDKIGVVVGEANHLTLASLCRHRRQVLHDTGHRSERLNRLFMSGKPELGRYTCEARIGKEPVRTRSSLLNDRVLQQSVYE